MDMAQNRRQFCRGETFASRPRRHRAATEQMLRPYFVLSITFALSLIAAVAIGCAPGTTNVAANSNASPQITITPTETTAIPPSTHEPSATPQPATPVATADTLTRTPSPTSVQTLPAASTDPVLLAAGDIGQCGMKAEATARLLDNLPGTIITLGDNAYPNGAPRDFANCYAPTWGRQKARTHPVPGNHDYVTAGASGYFGYFGAAAGPAGKGYYSYDLGAWHLVALNSEIAVRPGSVQEQWLRADLAAHRATCTLAYWHQPRFSSGPHSSNATYQPLWQALYDYGADIVLNGHDHDYERFAPQTPGGEADPQHGIREFVVGTGGAVLYPFMMIAPNSEVKSDKAWGVLKLTLHAASYAWQFIPIAGQTFADSGTADCH